MIGRLTASLLHDINNPIQAIRGSLSLALEDLNDAEALQLYLDLGIRESDRIIELIACARRLYSNYGQTYAYVNINHLLHELKALTTKELANKHVQLEQQLAESLPPVWAVFGELSQAFLCPLLTLSDLMAECGGGILAMRSVAMPEAVKVSFATAVFPHPLPKIPLLVCDDIIHHYGGYTHQSYQADQSLNLLDIILPVSIAAT